MTRKIRISLANDKGEELHQGIFEKNFPKTMLSLYRWLNKGFQMRAKEKIRVCEGEYNGYLLEIEDIIYDDNIIEYYLICIDDQIDFETLKL